MRSLKEKLQSVEAERTSAQPSIEEMEKLQSRVTSLTEERDQLQEILEGLRQEKNQLRAELEEQLEMVRYYSRHFYTLIESQPAQKVKKK